LHRLVVLTRAPEDKARVTLREAKLLAETLGDQDGAVARYLFILDEVDAKNIEAVHKIIEIEEKRGNHKAVADALERQLTIVADDQEKLETARKLASLYESTLDDPARAIRTLDIVHSLDPEDFETTSRLQVLCEKV